LPFQPIANPKPALALLEVDFFRISISRQACRQMIFCVEQPSVASVG
jgi:hypothetical protein